jgi:DNA invertase Pin-like site-specific DNA recombinase
MTKATTRPQIRAALYTRKSSEEGLDQSFNSLDAQREACAAYVKSQASEGWRALTDHFDDGGVSGGTMDRPALKRLLAAIEAGRIDVVVVYKIDRLTRSLTDFARMVDIFDRHNVSFVSVTQAFNTTTSMGRLTLNVLLSFAQFEREVTGERIRDKIAASKAKGMWMGGVLPLGYDRPADGTRALKVNPVEAEQVRRIFSAYLRLGSVHALEQALLAEGVRSKPRQGSDGTMSDGHPLSRGALFQLLRNPLYIGQIRHKGVLHPGRHDAIVDRGLFDAVQAHLTDQARRKARGSTPEGSGEASATGSALTGRIFDAEGHRMSPTFATGRGGRRYRYYVSAPLQQGRKLAGPAPRRVPAALLEATIATRLRAIKGVDPAAPFDSLVSVTVRTGALDLVLPDHLRDPLAAHILDEERLEDASGADRRSSPGVRLTIPFAVFRRGSPLPVVPGPTRGPVPDPVLIRALRQAHALLDRDATGRPILHAAPRSPYAQKLVRLAFLAPSLQTAILEGRQPQGLTLTHLLAAEIPLDWAAQRAKFGIAAA